MDFYEDSDAPLYTTESTFGWFHAISAILIGVGLVIGFFVFGPLAAKALRALVALGAAY